jgi:predicted secreted protein
VDVLDASSGRLAWRGSGRRVFDAKQTPQQRNERIASAANAVVSEFASR